MKTSGPEKNDRSIFMYMAPPSNAADWVKKQWAQCGGGCRMLVPQAALPAEGKHKKGCDLCVILGSQERVDAGENRGSCGEFAVWPTPDCTPDQDVVKEHAAKLASGAPGSATKEEVGYVERPVRCENCFFPKGNDCGWFKELSEKLPEYFKDDGKIELGACCNSQTAPIKSDGQAADSIDGMAMDWSGTVGLRIRQYIGIAFDRKTLRRYDGDGRLHLETSHISKANVSEYFGNEIPDWQELGLVPDKLYRLYRGPEELAKAAATFNNIPILSRHVPVDAENHRPELVIGSTGTDASFADGYLDNSLVFWAGEAISDIENDIKKELSSAYRYRADMTPGTSPAGEAHDGVMRDLVGNHVALVKEGRAGPDVLVGDSAIEKPTGEIHMSKRIQSLKATIAVGALIPFLKPRLAQDAKIDLGKVFANVKPKTFGNMKDAIAADIMKLTKGKLAKDAKIGSDGKLEGLGDILDMIDGDKSIEDEDDMVGEDPDESMDAEGGGLQEFLKGKLGEDDYAKACDMLKPKAADAEETDEEKSERERKEKEAKDKAAKDEEDKKKEDTKAMDAKIDAAVKAERKLASDIATAREDVRPHVGALKGAFDSVEGVYRAALTVLGVEEADKIEGVNGLKAVLKTQTTRAAPKQATAMDAAQSKSYAERFPGAAKIKVNA